MAVQKYVISKNSSNFTVFPNKVLQGLNYCLEALGLFVYLASLPPAWTFHKSHLSASCNIGANKLDKLLKVLAHHNMVSVQQVRDAQGRFAHFDVQIFDGSDFISHENNDLENRVQPFNENRGTVNGAMVLEPINTINKKETKNIKQKLLSASEDARDRFGEFWAAYPRKVNKMRAAKIWKSQKLDERATEILADISKRKALDAQWLQLQYIPHPTTYLNGQRWEDEITPHAPIAQNVQKPNYPAPRNDVKSTVRAWEAGNPDYDRFHGITH